MKKINIRSIFLLLGVFFFINCREATITLPSETTLSKEEKSVVPVVETVLGNYADKIEISWASIEGVETYRVYRANSDSEVFNDYDIVFDSGEDRISYSFTSPQSVSYFRVASVLPNNQLSALSAPILGRRFIAPTLLSTVGDSFTHIDLFWGNGAEDASNISSYRLEKETPSGWTVLVEADSEGTRTYRDTDVGAGATVKYQLSAINPNGHTSPYTLREVTINEQNGPNSVEDLSISQGTLSNKVQLSWHKPADLVGFETRKYNFTIIRSVNDVTTVLGPFPQADLATVDPDDATLELYKWEDNETVEGFPTTHTDKITYSVSARFDSSIVDGYTVKDTGWVLLGASNLVLNSSDLTTATFDLSWDAPLLESELSHYQLWGQGAGLSDPVLLADNLPNADNYFNLVLDYAANPEWKNIGAWDLDVRVVSTAGAVSAPTNSLRIVTDDSIVALSTSFTNFSASQGKKGEVVLNWDIADDSNVASYRVFRAENSGLIYVKDLADIILNASDSNGDGVLEDGEITPLTATTYTDTTAEKNKLYFYHVRAYDATHSRIAASSFDDKGDVIADTDVSGYRLASPTLIEASDGTSTDEIFVTWDAVLGATNYTLYNGSTEVASIDATADREFTYTDTSGNDIDFSLRAYNADGEYDGSVSDKGYILTGVNTTVNSSQYIYPDKVVLDWPAIKGAVSYQIKREGGGVTEFFSVDAPTSGTSLTYIDTYSEDIGSTGPHIQVLHDYTITPIGRNREGDIFTDAVPAAVAQGSILSPPTGLQTKDLTGSSISIEWTASPGADSYVVYLQTGTGDFTPVADGITDLFYTTRDASNIVYNYYVLAQSFLYGNSPRDNSVAGNLAQKPLRHPTTILSASDGMRYGDKTSGYYTLLTWAPVTDVSANGAVDGYEIYRQDRNLEDPRTSVQEAYGWNFVADVPGQASSSYNAYGGVVLAEYRHLFLIVPYITLASGNKARIGVTIDGAGIVHPVPSTTVSAIRYDLPLDSSAALDTVPTQAVSIDVGYRDISNREMLDLVNFTMRYSFGDSSNPWVTNQNRIATGGTFSSDSITDGGYNVYVTGVGNDYKLWTYTNYTRGILKLNGQINLARGDINAGNKRSGGTWGQNSSERTLTFELASLANPSGNVNYKGTIVFNNVGQSTGGTTVSGGSYAVTPDSGSGDNFSSGVKIPYFVNDEVGVKLLLGVLK